MHTIVRDSAIGGLAVFVILGLNFSTKVLLARALSAAELGVLLTAQAIIGLALVLGQLSLPDTVVRFAGLYVAHDISRAKGSLMSGLRLSLFGSGLLALALVTSTGWIAENLYHQATFAGVLVIFATAMPFTTVAEMLAAGYRGFGQLWMKVLCVDLARPLCVVIGLVYLISLGANTLLAVAAVFGITSLMAAILMFGLFWRSAYWRLPAARVPAGELLRYSLPLLAAGLFSGPIVNTGFPLLLACLASVQAVSYFSLSMSLQLLVNLPISALEQAALPAWSGQVGGGAVSGLHVSYAFFTRWGYVVASMVFALLFFNPCAVLSFLYGPEYTVAASAIQALSAVTLFGVATGPNDGMLRALGNTRWVFTSRLVAGIAAIGAGFAFIPQWGLMGAVVAFIISNVLTNGLYMAGLFWKYGIHPLDGPYIKTLMASLIAFLFIGFARPYLGDGFAGIGVTTAIYAILLAGLLQALHAFTAQDARALDHFLKHIRGLASKRSAV